MAFTCDPCLAGRHVRCERDGCACSICNAPRPIRVVKPQPVEPPGEVVATVKERPPARPKPTKPRTPRRVPPVEEILRLAQDPTLSARAIGRAVGFDHKTVLKVIADANFERPPKPPKPAKTPKKRKPPPLSLKLRWDEVRMVQLLHNAHATNREIAEHFGVSESMIQQLLKRIGDTPVGPPDT